LKAEDIRGNLRRAYNHSVDSRVRAEVAGWKLGARKHFMEMLLEENRKTLCDIGSGPGVHAAFFRDGGLDVTCIDLSPENVKRCRENGIQAYELDIVELDSLGTAFEAAFSMNSLLHIPRSELQAALGSIRRSLAPGGLFYWGQYGGVDSEGIYPEDKYEPKRFFSFMVDEQILHEAAQEFSLVEFDRVELDAEDELHYQSLILRVND
jgi:SAM-dependent methyltransferase